MFGGKRAKSGVKPATTAKQHCRYPRSTVATYHALGKLLHCPQEWRRSAPRSALSQGRKWHHLRAETPAPLTAVQTLRRFVSSVSEYWRWAWTHPELSLCTTADEFLPAYPWIENNKCIFKKSILMGKGKCLSRICCASKELFLLLKHCWISFP